MPARENVKRLSEQTVNAPRICRCDHAWFAVADQTTSEQHSRPEKTWPQFATKIDHGGDCRSCRRKQILFDNDQRLQRDRVALFLKQKQIKVRKTGQHRLLDQLVIFEILVRIAERRVPNCRIDIGGMFINLRAPRRERERIHWSGSGLFEQTCRHEYVSEANLNGVSRV